LKNEYDNLRNKLNEMKKLENKYSDLMRENEILKTNHENLIQENTHNK